MSRRDEQLFPEPSARVVWAGICALDEASQHDVLKELSRRLAFPAEREQGGPLGVKVSRAVAALREAAEQLGRSPSVSEYRGLRREGDHDWPPEGSIRDWLGGSWNTALERAHLEAVAEHQALIVEGQHAFTPEECIEAMRACAAEIGKAPTFNNYLNWARRPDVRRRPGRRPRSQAVFERCFGGYIPALRAANLNSGNGAGVPISTLQRSGKNYRWADVDLYRAIDEVIRFAGLDRFPTFGEYRRAREQILEQRSKEADPAERPLPAMNAFQRRFGGWRITGENHERWHAAQQQASQ